MTLETLEFLTNQILVAMPTLADPNFFQSTTLVCQHTTEGAMGITFNRPTGVSLAEILQHLGVGLEGASPEHAERLKETSVYVGGPLQRERGFVIHEPCGSWESSVSISPELSITSSRDILEAIARGDGPPRCLVALGYAAWGPRQLEAELAMNVWLSAPCDPHLLFAVPDQDRWRAAASSIGVNLDLMSDVPGHA